MFRAIWVEIKPPPGRTFPETSLHSVDSPEMRALLRLLNDWQPSLYLDIHVTDGVDYQYDITYGFHGWDGDFAWSPKAGKWLDATLRPAFDAALKKAGHIPGPLVFAVDRRDITRWISLGLYNPRYSSGYGDLRHSPAVLVENHSLKTYRQRVLGTRVLMEASLEVLGQNATSLAVAIADDSAAAHKTKSEATKPRPREDCRRQTEAGNLSDADQS